jgi:class 3 adenylate cyclase
MNDRVSRNDHGRRTRKTVTVVFADLAGSTALAERLDPESLDHLLTSYYAHMRGVLEQHGGTVEKFIGDAVVGVFGVPTLHEDDALRAVRAAIQMRDQLPELNASLAERFGVGLSMHIGIGTGEVVSDREATGHALVAGRAGNLAARLQTAAPTGEILVASATRRLVAAAVRLAPHATLELRGVPGRRRTRRVGQERPQPALARPGGAMVGRRRQLRTLHRRAELAFGSTI